jgi:hypothetical protein
MILPNLFEVTGDLGSDPSLIGWVKLGLRSFMHRFETGLVILLGVVREVRHSVGGAMVAMTMVEEILSRFEERKTGWIEGGWVLDDNVPLQKILKQYGFRITRTMRIYEKSLASA